MRPPVEPFKTQLLKWIGNKQRFAHEIASFLPLSDTSTYFEPFLGSGAVLGTLAPERAIATDTFAPLMGVWSALAESPELLIQWYAERWEQFNSAADRVAAYERI